MNRPQGFISGFTKRSYFKLFAITSLLLTSFLYIEYFFVCGTVFKNNINEIVRDNVDDFMYVTKKVHTLETRTNNVYLLGGSSMREATQSGFLNGTDWHDINLGSSSQNFGDTIAIADNLPQETNLFLLGINITRFYFSIEDLERQNQSKRILLRSSWLSDFLNKNGYIQPSLSKFILIPAIKYLANYLNTRFINRKSDFTYKRHIYDSLEPLSNQEKIRKIKDGSQNIIEGFDRNFEVNYLALNFLIKKIKSTGGTPILVDLPYNTIANKFFHKQFKYYQRRVSKLAQTEHINYWNYTDELQLLNKNFYDMSHLYKEGRKYYQNYLRKKIISFKGNL